MLTVYMPVPWGIGKNSFLVDDIDFVKLNPEADKYVAVRGVIGPKGAQETVVIFPSELQYTLIERGQFEMLTYGDMKAEHKKEHDEAKADGCEDDGETPRQSGNYL